MRPQASPASTTSPAVDYLDTSDVAVGTKVVPRRRRATGPESLRPGGLSAECRDRVACAPGRDVHRPTVPADGDAARVAEGVVAGRLATEGALVREALTVGERAIERAP